MSNPSEPGQQVMYVLEKLPKRAAREAVDLPAIIGILWGRRIWIVGAVLLSAALGAAYSLQATPWFRSETTLLPVSDRASGLSGQIAQLGGLASLAGISVGGGADRAEPLGVLRSRDFIGEFIKARNLLPVLFPEKWDSARSAWKTAGADTPDLRDGIDKFTKDILRIDEDRKSGLVVVAVEWIDAESAAEWANDLVARINAQMRAKAQSDAMTSIAFLQAELNEPGQVSLKQATGRLLESELEKLMLARGREEFSFRVIDRAQVPKKRVRPQRTLIVIASALVGLLAGVLAVLLAEQFEAASRRGTPR